MNGEPEIFGKYVLLERLAAGGMGEVFLARAGSKGFEKFFALKRILGQHAESPEFVRMLMNEARISVMLVHPNIAQVFEFGQINQTFYMALEYIEGLSLNSVLRRGREARLQMRAADAVWVALQICRALHYAHNKRDNDGNDLNIVHRDVSPHNILIDEGGSVRLIDFGIAKASQGQIQTEASTIKGKIPYMSPEQASGQPIDRRSDIYALGIVLYECLTSERMYPSGNTFETFALVRHGKIPDLDDKLEGKVPASLLTLLKRALQLKADDRFKTAAEMESDLSRILHELEPGHTSYALADLVQKLDNEREIRKDRLKSFAKIVPEELMLTSGPSPPREVSKPTPRVLAPPLPVDITLGSLGSMAPTSLEKAKDSSGSLPSPTVETIDAAPQIVPRRLGLGASVGLVGVALVIAVAAVVILRPPATSAATELAVAPSPTVAPHAETAAAPAAPAPMPVAAALPVVAPMVAPLAAATPAAAVPAPVAPSPVKHNTKPHVDVKHGASVGCVAVNVVPWAYVSEHDKRLGQTPLPCLELSVGRHTLTLENPALGKSKSVNVVVTAGDTARVVERF